MADQVAQFVIFKADHVKQQNHVPQGDRVIIFDEIKVACQITWTQEARGCQGWL